MTLYQHKTHPHTPRNPNDIHSEEQEQAGFNTKLAVLLTKTVGTMPTAYLFVLLAIIGLLGILSIIPPIVALLVAWTSQTLIQLVLLPVIMVGQNVLSHKQEIQSGETFQTTMKSFHDIEQLMKHMDAQDQELVKQTRLILAQQDQIQRQNELVEKLMRRIDLATGRGAA